MRQRIGTPLLRFFVVNNPPSADSIGVVRVVSHLSLHRFPGY